MAVLETIRVKLGWFITILIAVALLLFIIDYDSLMSAINVSSSKYAVGKIDGKKVPYKDFQEQVEYQTRMFEIANGSSVNGDEQQNYVREMAWQHFIDENLFIPKAKGAGINVGKDEMVAICRGDVVSPVFAYNPYFSPNGKFDKERLADFVKGVSADESGTLKDFWAFLQNQALVMQYRVKYQSLFNNANYNNKLDIQNAMENANNVSTADVVMVPFGYAKDSTITVSKSEIKSYYKAHKNFYKQVANRDIAYALFEVTPSESDIEAAKKSVEDIYDDFKTTDNAKNFLLRNASEEAYKEYYYSAGELVPVNYQINEFVFGPDAAQGVSPVIRSGNSFFAAKIVETKMIPDSVYVRHILIQGNNNLADSLMNVISKDKSQFSSLAALYSADQNPNNLPGEIGWMTQNNMIPGMECVLTAATNKPFIKDTKYGRHIIEVTKATKPIEKKLVAVFKRTAMPSDETLNTEFAKANDLAVKAAGKFENLQAAAKEANIFLHEENVTEATQNFSGADHAKELTRWIFDAKKGAASDVKRINQYYLFVVGVKDVHEEGYKTVEEARADIESLLYDRKKADKLSEEVKTKIEGCATMEDVAKALGQTVSLHENVSFASQLSYDNEPALVGAISGAEEGKIVGPVKGMMGVYVLQVKSRSTEDNYSDDMATQNLARKNQYSTQLLPGEMFESTESVDNRERFY